LPGQFGVVDVEGVDVVEVVVEVVVDVVVVGVDVVVVLVVVGVAVVVGAVVVVGAPVVVVVVVVVVVAGAVVWAWAGTTMEFTTGLVHSPGRKWAPVIAPPPASIFFNAARRSSTDRTFAARGSFSFSRSSELACIFLSSEDMGYPLLFRGTDLRVGPSFSRFIPFDFSRFLRLLSKRAVLSMELPACQRTRRLSP